MASVARVRRLVRSQDVGRLRGREVAVGDVTVVGWSTGRVVITGRDGAGMRRGSVGRSGVFDRMFQRGRNEAGEAQKQQFPYLISMKKVMNAFWCRSRIEVATVAWLS